jgi:hypothetical protein
MRVNLHVPYADNAEAKRLGARWDGVTWYVQNVEDMTPFLPWMPAHLTRPHGAKETTHKATIRTGCGFRTDLCNCGLPPWELCSQTCAHALVVAGHK